MDNERKIDRASKFDKLKWLVLGIIVFYLLTLFVPLVYKIYYPGTEKEDIYILYWYTFASSSESTERALVGNESLSFNLLVPILTAVFLFLKSEKKKILFFTTASLFILKTILFLVSVNNLFARLNTLVYSYTYYLVYGYYLMWIAVCAFAIATIYLFIVHIKSKKEEKQKSIIDIMKDRLALLDGMKAGGILTEEEYDAKRAELIHELKL